MRIALVGLFGFLIVAGLALARPKYARGAEPRQAENESLRRELLRMKDRDQRARAEYMTRPDEDHAARLKALDAQHSERMKAIVGRYGWPGRRLVGTDGAHAAWLLVQHATADLELMKHCLELMECAAAAGDASRADLAYLTDRVRMLEGRPQLFGTQFREDSDGPLQPYPIEDEARVDQRRKSVGLPTLAEYEKQLRAYYEKKSPPRGKPE